MKPTHLLAVAAVLVAGLLADVVRSSAQKDEQVAPLSGLGIPNGYRDWKLISVAREEGDLDAIPYHRPIDPDVRVLCNRTHDDHQA
jgi:hypothetical protein